LLFGYLIEAKNVMNPDTLIWSLAIVLIIFLVRAVQIWLSKLPIIPLLFVAPRGLITILLFISIAPIQSIWFVNKALITQVIILTAFVMMFGLMINKKTPEVEKSMPVPTE